MPFRRLFLAQLASHAFDSPAKACSDPPSPQINCSPRFIISPLTQLRFPPFDACSGWTGLRTSHPFTPPLFFPAPQNTMTRCHTLAVVESSHGTHKFSS